MKRPTRQSMFLWLRRRQLSESLVRYLAAAFSILIVVLVTIIMDTETSSLFGLWVMVLTLGAVPMLLGLRPLASLVTTSIAILVPLFGIGIPESTSGEMLSACAVPLVLLLFVRFGARWPTLVAITSLLGGAFALLVWLLPWMHIFSDDMKSASDQAIMFFCIAAVFVLPGLVARSDTSRVFQGSLLISDFRDGSFRVTGAFTAVLGGLTAASNTTVQLRRHLVSTGLESLVSVAGWVIGGIVTGGLLWIVWKLPAALSRGQMSGRVFPNAATEALWLIVIMGMFGMLFALAVEEIAAAVLLMLTLVISYSLVRILLSAPLPAGQSPLWIISLKPVTSATRATARRMAASWKVGPTVLMALPDSALRMADGHMRACVKARALDRLFPLRPAHLADWDEGLPPSHAWNALPVRELYAAAALWPEILAARLTPQSRVVALESAERGVLVAATSHALRLHPSLSSAALAEVAAAPLEKRTKISSRLSKAQGKLRQRVRRVLILHGGGDLEAAWGLHARLAGVHDAGDALVQPYVLRYDALGMPVGFAAWRLPLIRRMLGRRRKGFAVADRLLGILMAICVAQPADEYDVVVLEPQTALPRRSNVTALLGRLIDSHAIDRVFALRSPADGGAASLFEPRQYTGEIRWNSAPALSARVADAAQKVLGATVPRIVVAGGTPEQAAQPAAGAASAVAAAHSPAASFGGCIELRHESQLASAAYSPRAPLIVTTGRDCTARIWQAQTGESTGVVVRHESSVRFAAFDPTGTVLATGGKEGAVKVWEVGTGKELAVLLAHEGLVQHVSFSPDGRRLASSGDLCARLWDLQAQRVVSIMWHQAAVVRAEFSPNGDRILTCSQDNTACLWEPASGKPIGEQMRHERPVLDAVFSPNGRIVATASADRTARLWDAHSGVPLGSTMRHDRGISRIVFSPDGQLVATASNDGTARLWNATSGLPDSESEIMVHPAAVNCVAFNRNGARLATACDDGWVREWDFSGLPLKEHEVGGHAYYVAYSPVNSDLVVIDSSNSGKLWLCGTDAK